MREFKFENDQYYHIYNRGIDKRRVFLHKGQYRRFLNTIYNLLHYGKVQKPKGILINKSLAFKTKLSFICYCLMPNHYHFLIRQKADNAISQFMHALNTNHTKYFNLTKKRTGRLFEYTFKALHIVSDEILIVTPTNSMVSR